MKIGQRWPENEMRECKVIFSRALKRCKMQAARLNNKDGRPGYEENLNYYLTMLTNSCKTSSVVVIVLALAWNAL